MASDLPSMNNITASSRQLIGLQSGGWLSALKDVKEKVQSVAPVLPKLLPNAMVQSIVARKENAVNSLADDSCSKEMEASKENNCYEYTRPFDVNSAHIPASESTNNESSNNNGFCDEEAASAIIESPSESVDDSSVSDHICDEHSVASTESDVNPSSSLSSHCDQITAANNTESTDNESLARESSSCDDIRQQSSSAECEVPQQTEMASQHIVSNPPVEMRNFSTDVTDSPEIIYSSSRKKQKPVKHGIYIFGYIYLHIILSCIIFTKTRAPEEPRLAPDPTKFVQLTLRGSGKNFLIKIMIWISTEIEWFIARETLKPQKFFLKEYVNNFSSYHQNSLDCPIPQVKKFLQKFLDLDSDPDDFQNLMVTFSSKRTIVVKFS